MRVHKTVSVGVLKDRANYFLANSKDEEQFERIAIANFLGTILHETGNYHGFKYLTDITVGDETRRAYF